MADTTRKVEIQFKLLDDFSGALQKIVNEIKKTTGEVVKQETRVGRLQRAFRTFGASLKRFVITPLIAVRNVLNSVSRSILNVRTAFAGIIAGLAVRRAINEFFETAKALDEIGESAKKLGLSAGDLNAFRFVAEQVGTDIASLGAGLRIASRNIAAFVRSGGQGELAAAFKRLGVSVKDLQLPDGSLKSMGELLPVLADRFATLGDTIERTALAQQIFGRGGSDLIPLLELGGDALRRLRREQELLVGTDLDRQVVAASDLQDAIVRVRQAFFGLKAAIVTELAPAVTDFFNSAAAGIAAFRATVLRDLSAGRADIVEVLNAFTGLFVSVGVTLGSAFASALTQAIIKGMVAASPKIAATFFRAVGGLSLADTRKVLDEEIAALEKRIAEIEPVAAVLSSELLTQFDKELEGLRERLKEVQSLRAEFVQSQSGEEEGNRRRLREVSKDLAESLKEELKLAKEEITLAVDAFKGELSGISPDFATELEKVSEALEKPRKSLSDRARELWAGVVGQFREGVANVKGEVQKFIDVTGALSRDITIRRARVTGDDALIARLELEEKIAKERVELEKRAADIGENVLQRTSVQLTEIENLERGRLNTQIKLEDALKGVAAAENVYEDSLRDVDILLKQGSISEAEARRQTSLRAEALRNAATAAKAALVALRSEAGGMGLSHELDEAIRKMDQLIARTLDAEPVVRNFFQAAIEGARQFKNELGSALAGVTGLVRDQLGNLRGGLGEVFSGIIRGTKDLSAAWTSMLDRMIDTLGNFLADAALREFLGILGFQPSSLLGGLSQSFIGGAGGGAATQVATGSAGAAAAAGVSEAIGADLAKTATSTAATEVAVKAGTGVLLPPTEASAGFLGGLGSILVGIGTGVANIFSFITGAIINGILAVVSAIGSLATVTTATSFLPFAAGGLVPGPAGAGDVVPAKLTPGELVIPREKVRAVLEVLRSGPRQLADWATRIKTHIGPAFGLGGIAGSTDSVPAMLTPGERVLTVRENFTLKRLMTYLRELEIERMLPLMLGSLAQPPRDIIRGLESLRRVAPNAGPFFAQGGTVTQAPRGRDEPTAYPVPIPANDKTARELSRGGRYEWMRFIRENAAEVNLALRSAQHGR